MHHILYEDGENEWVSLSKEIHAWAPSLPGRSYPAGLAPGESALLSSSVPCLYTCILQVQLCQLKYDRDMKVLPLHRLLGSPATCDVLCNHHPC